MGFLFCSFLNRLKQELIKLILIMLLENVIGILSVLHHCKSLHKKPCHFSKVIFIETICE